MTLYSSNPHMASMTRYQRIIRRSISLFWTALTLVTVTLAVLVGLGKLLLPYSERYQPQLEKRLSEVIRAPVRIQRFSGDWKAFGPRLELEGLQIFPEQGGENALLVIDHAAVDIRPLAMLFPGKAVYQFTIIGADLKFVRDLEGNLSVSGVGLKSSSSSTINLASLSSLGEIRLEKFNLTLDDELLDMKAELKDLNARLQFHKDSMSVEFHAQVPGKPGPAAAISGSAEILIRDSQAIALTAWLESRVSDIAAIARMFPAEWTVQASGHGKMEFWVNWSAESGVDILGKVDNNDLSLQLHPHGDSVYAEHVGGYFHFKRQARNEWRLELTGLEVSALGREWQADAIQVVRSEEPGRQMWVLADGGDIGFARPIVQGLMRRWRPADDKWVLAEMDGQLQYLELLLGDGWQPRIIKAAGTGLTLKKWKNWPAIQGMDASIDFVDGEGKLEITSPEAIINWPRVFRQPVVVGKVDCPIELERHGKGQWKAWSDDCRLENDAFAVSTSLYLEGNVKRPYMRAVATIERADIGKLGPYWADAIMSPQAVTWLRRGLLGGRVEAGSFTIDGDLDDWPFRNDEGVFSADFSIEGGRLAYTPGWPVAKKIATRVVIRNSVLEVSGASGLVGNMPVQQANATVQMRRPVLVELDFSGAADASALMQFIIDSPLDELMKTDFSTMKFEGPATVSGHLKIDSTDTLGKVRVSGEIGLQDVRLHDDRWDLSLDKINGQLVFSETGLAGSDISASFKGYPVTGELQAGPGYAGDYSFRAVVSGIFPAQAIVSPRFDGLALFTDHLNGMANWRIETYAPRREAGETAASWLVVDSDLVGIESTLPAPLRKSAADKLPLHLLVPLTGDDAGLELNITGLAAVQLQFDREDYTLTGANIVFGDQQAPRPEPGYLRMSGSVEELNLDGWMDFFGSDWQSKLPGTGLLKMDELQLDVANLHLVDRDFQAVSLTAHSQNNRWKVIFDSKQLEGSVHLPSQAQKALIADFKVLHLPLPQTGGLKISTDPRNVPALHLYAGDLRYGNLHLGETRLEAWPTGEGLHFESVESTTAEVAVRASGDWYVAEGQQWSNFVINITSESLGGLLDSMSVDASMKGGQTLVAMDASWPGAPSAFSMENVTGTLTLSLIDGHIPNAQPGAGRLLGLLSLQALPRRLALDFRDVFASGLKFDHANGTFSLVNGVAHTNDLEVISPAAVIKVSGDTDFNNKAYDQIIVIEPGVGSTLPLIGAITAGPGGAAAGLALQGLLNKPLGRVVQVQYSLTGPWSEPVIKAISAKQVPHEEPDNIDEKTGEAEPVANIEAMPGSVR